ncbi:HTH domain-containing protein [Priestia megaterium]|uniref:HTH domain-containing protein n=1 Tax=Priestia megaterium TaxID=1404 RepID=UPI0023DAE430|nr:HTH domain-containing protein [Priestia megaterium]MDF2058534.1 HTH domain-containing protein [Priestia megaterium]MDF2064741.1 HTH domain-containing protein [Priestia megaterium]
MLIGEMLTKITKEELTIKELATMYSVTTQTIQRKIKKLGYEWDKKKSIYKYIGKSPQPLDIDFSTLFRKRPIINNNLSELKGKNKKKGIVRNSTSDVVDVLLAGTKPPSKRVYQGFYFDKDVLSIINSVPKNYKSELINEALRKVFKEKGLLK